MANYTDANNAKSQAIGKLKEFMSAQKAKPEDITCNIAISSGNITLVLKNAAKSAFLVLSPLGTTAAKINVDELKRAIAAELISNKAVVK
jgi:hypothetical protein